MLTGPITLIKKSFEIFFKKENFIYFLQIYSIPLALSLISIAWSGYLGSMGYASNDYYQLYQSNSVLGIYATVMILVSVVLSLWAGAASYLAIINVVGMKELNFKDTYKKALPFVFKFFLMSIILGLIIMGGALLLVVGAIVFGVWFSFTFWNFFEKQTAVWESFKLSKSMVKGKFWAILGRFIVFILFAMAVQIAFGLLPLGYLTAVFTVFGGLFLLPYYLLYQEVSAGYKK